MPNAALGVQAMTDHPGAQHLVRELSRFRLRVSTEAALQRDIEQALNMIGADYAREQPLSAGDRPDFMVGDVVIEAKARYRKRSIYLQLERYAAHDTVAAIILVTNTAMGMPEYINGKPIYVISTGIAYL